MAANCYVLSLRDVIRSPAYCCVVEFEDVIVKCLGAKLIKPTDADSVKSKNGRNILFVVGISISDVVTLLRSAENFIEKFDDIYGYVFDSILYQSEINKAEWKKIISSYFRTVRKITRIFVPMSYAVTEFERTFNVLVSYIPLASDVFKFGGVDDKKIIDVNGYGRQDLNLSRKLSELFNHPDGKRIYHHTDHMSISNINDYYAHRRFFWKILRKSKIALAFDPVAADNNSRFRFSFVGQRWFESASAGCVIVGRKPTCPEMESLFSWEKSTIELPDNPEEMLVFIENLLNDEQELNKISVRNYVCSLTRNDWRHRLLDILKIIDLSPPPSLIDDIEILADRADYFPSIGARGCFLSHR